MIESFAKMKNKNFTAAEDIGGVGAFSVEVIKDFQFRDAFNQRTNTMEKVPTLVFEGERKPLILNKTNVDTLQALFSPGEDKPQNCVGKTIELYVVACKVGRHDTTGTRIRQHFGVMCEECGQEIRPTATRTVDQLTEISMRNTGKVLCISCMQKFARERKEETKE